MKNNLDKKTIDKIHEMSSYLGNQTEIIYNLMLETANHLKEEFGENDSTALVVSLHIFAEVESAIYGAMEPMQALAFKKYKDAVNEQRETWAKV